MALLLLMLGLSLPLINAQTTTTATTTTSTTRQNTTGHAVSTVGCEENKVYNDCGSNCPPNCTHFDPPPVCNRMCAKGCFCKEGYLEDENRACVPRALCESCTGNTTFSNCGTGCPQTCDSPEDSHAEMCSYICKIGCACKKGYVFRSGKQGACVLRQDCPVVTNIKQG
ncbi:serine protease inhibitor swm-1-like [Pelodytes ibericus]